MIAKPRTPSNDPKDFDRAYVRQNADPNCPQCKGQGWLWQTDPTDSRRSEKSDLMSAIGGVPATDQEPVSTTARICPYCFDPEHRPRFKPNKFSR